MIWLEFFSMLQLPIKQAASELTLRTWPRRRSRKTEGRQKLRGPKEWPGRSRSRRRLGGNWRSVRFKSHWSTLVSVQCWEKRESLRKGSFFPAVLSSSKCVFVPVLQLCLTPAWPFPPVLLPFGSPTFPLGTEELLWGELCGPQEALHVQGV